eukprot:2346998-Alexandrium_andersonii.AAC.1
MGCLGELSELTTEGGPGRAPGSNAPCVTASWLSFSALCSLATGTERRLGVSRSAWAHDRRGSQAVHLEAMLSHCVTSFLGLACGALSSLATCTARQHVMAMQQCDRNLDFRGTSGALTSATTAGVSIRHTL